MEDKEKLNIVEKTLTKEELTVEFNQNGTMVNKNYVQGFQWTLTIDTATNLTEQQIENAILSPTIYRSFFPLLHFTNFKDDKGNIFSSPSQRVTLLTTYEGKQPVLEKGGAPSVYQVVALEKSSTKVSITIDQLTLGNKSPFTANTVTLTIEKIEAKMNCSITMRCTPLPGKTFSQAIANKVVGQQPLQRMQRYFKNPTLFIRQSERLALVDSSPINEEQKTLLLKELKEKYDINVQSSEGFTASFTIKDINEEKFNTLTTQLSQPAALKKLFHDIDETTLPENNIIQSSSTFTRKMNTITWGLQWSVAPIQFNKTTQEVPFTIYPLSNGYLLLSAEDVHHFHQLAFAIQYKQVGNDMQIDVSTIHSYSTVANFTAYLKEEPKLMISLAGMTQHDTFKRHLINYIFDELFPYANLQSMQEAAQQQPPIFSTSATHFKPSSTTTYNEGGQNPMFRFTPN